MEIPVTARLNILQNPSLIFRVFSNPGIEKVSHVYTFWKWGALILALIAAFGSVVRRIRLVVLRLRKAGNSGISEPLLSQLDFSDDDDDTCSSSSSVDEEEEYQTTTSFEERTDTTVDEDFNVAGSCYNGEEQWQNRNLKLRRRRSSGDRFSWSDFANGKSVVKLWDGVGLGLDLENSSGSFVSIWDLNRCQTAARSAASPSPSLVVSAAVYDKRRSVGVSVWDARVGWQRPTIFTEWRQPVARNAGPNSGGVEKLYVTDDARCALTGRDVRKVNSPLEELTECDGDTWWDADAVIVADECINGSTTVNGCDSVVSRCRNAVRSYLL